MRASSIEAQQNSKHFIDNHYKVILKVMREINEPVTSKQISEKCILTYHAVARRLSEMERLNKIKVVGRKQNEKFKPLLWEIA